MLGVEQIVGRLGFERGGARQGGLVSKAKAGQSMCGTVQSGAGGAGRKADAIKFQDKCNGGLDRRA